jgi:hypothetical protein
MIKIHKIKKSDIDFRKSPNRWWQFFRRWYIANKPGWIEFHTDIGVFVYTWEAGFGCDGRSGGVFVDPIFPNWGNDLEKSLVIAHDISFYGFDISFELANELLRDTMRFIGKAEWRCKAVYRGVSTWIARKAYGCATDKEKANKALCGLKWTA